MTGPGLLRSFLLLAAATAIAGAFAQGTPRLILDGYDPVAYFTDGKPVRGDPRLAFEWDEGRYQFSTPKHRDMFAADPERFAPQFGGYCTGSMALGTLHEGNPEAWVIHNGKLYVFASLKYREEVKRDPAYIPTQASEAEKNWRLRK